MWTTLLRVLGPLVVGFAATKLCTTTENWIYLTLAVLGTAATVWKPSVGGAGAEASSLRRVEGVIELAGLDRLEKALRTPLRLEPIRPLNVAPIEVRTCVELERPARLAGAPLSDFGVSGYTGQVTTVDASSSSSSSSAAQPELESELANVLRGLGFPAKEARNVAKSVVSSHPDAGLEELVRAALTKEGNVS